MKYLSITLALLMTAAFSSCGSKDNNNTETSINARADSIVGTRLQEINQQAMDDLDKRMTIEVKVKADSIIALRMGKGRTNDTTKIVPRVPDEEIIKKTQLADVKDSIK